MNLYINLLLDSERRSTSRISRKFILKLAAVIFSVLLAAVGLTVFIGSRSASQSLLFAQQEQKQLDKVFKAVVEMNRELTDLRNVTNTINSWACTRPDWPRLLVGLQAVVPQNIQLLKFTMNEKIIAVDDGPARIISLYMKGKASGEHTGTDVEQLKKSLKETSVFSEYTEIAVVKQFDAVKADGQQNMRVFDIECRFKPQKLFQPAKKPKASK